MDPATHRLLDNPRDNGGDAFFAADRSTGAVSRSARLLEIKAKKESTITIPGFQSRHTVTRLLAGNPLPHQRMEKGKLDTTLVGWTDEVSYQGIISKSAASLAPGKKQPRLRVTLMFGVGSEMHRHGLGASVEHAPAPTLLILVRGIEPTHEVTFTSPTGVTKAVAANNRWGGGITTQTIENVITAMFGGLVDYDVVACAAYSTGHYGLAGSITRRLFPLDKLERVVIFDCLYTSLDGPLSALRRLRPTVQIIAYIASPGGNSFPTGVAPSFETLAMGRRPGFHYINLFMRPAYHAVASARVVSEGMTAANPIITKVPPTYETALNNLIGKLPPRLSVVSDAEVFKRIRGSLPTGSMTLQTIEASAKREIGAYFGQVGITRQCLAHGRLLGWGPTPGEEWHDLLLVEYAWEYLG